MPPMTFSRPTSFAYFAQPLGDELRMLDEVGGVPDDARDEHRALGQLHLLEDPPLVLVAGVGGLDRVARGADAEDDVDDVLERNVVAVRAVEAPPADVQPHLLARDAAQGVVDRVDAQRGVLAVVAHAHVRIHLPAVGQVRVVDLQQKPGGDDRLVLSRIASAMASTKASSLG